MLQRHILKSGVAIYSSSLLERNGVPHAFTTRHGGISPPPCDTLNLGVASCSPADAQQPAIDSPTHIAANYRRLQEALDCSARSLAWVNQVHGSDIHIIGDDSIPKGSPAADALATDSRTPLLSIRTADCVPILLAAITSDRRGVTAVAAVHAGWRGTTAGIVPKTVALLASRWKVDPSRVIAAIGPCISAAHFEVGEEVAAAFNAAGLQPAIQPRPNARPHIDLPLAILEQLRRAGVPEASIDRTDRCTYRDADDFFSHRRDAGRTGRMAAVIAMP